MAKKSKIDISIKSLSDDTIMIKGGFSGGETFLLYIVEKFTDTIVSNLEESDAQNTYMALAAMFLEKAMDLPPKKDEDDTKLN